MFLEIFVILVDLNFRFYGIFMVYFLIVKVLCEVCFFLCVINFLDIIYWYIVNMIFRVVSVRVFLIESFWVFKMNFCLVIMYF